MKINFSSGKRNFSFKGFTLMECLLAMAVVSVLMTTFMAVFLPSKKSIQSSLSIQEANRLSTALSAEFDVLRPGEIGKYQTPFDKAFDWMQKTNMASRSIVIYNYRGDLSKPLRSNGTLQPYTKDASIPGANTFVTTSVILLENDAVRLKEDLPAIIGPVFVVQMTQYVWSDTKSGAPKSDQARSTTGGSYVLAKKPGAISNPYKETQIVSTPDQYVYDVASTSTTEPWGAEVIYKADFYMIPLLQEKAIQKLSFDKLKKPVFSRNSTFRR